MSKRPNKKEVAERIEFLRAQLGYSQSRLAAEVGVHLMTANKWCVGKSLPRAEELAKLASVLGVSVTELLSGEASDVVVSPVLRDFFSTPEGARLNGSQKLALSKLLEGQEIDVSRVKSAVILLFGQAPQKN